MASLTKLFKFSFTELAVLLEAWFTFTKWDLLISFTKYERWRNKVNLAGNLIPALDKADSSTAPSIVTLEEHSTTANISQTTLTNKIKPLIKLSEIAARFHIRKMNCLRRCLSQQQMLKKRGFNAQMHIGVCFEEQKLLAHAWLTLQGQVINDSETLISRYSELKVNNEQTILNALK